MNTICKVYSDRKEGHHLPVMNESAEEQCQFSDRDTKTPTCIKLQPAWRQTGADPWAAGCGLVTAQSPKWAPTMANEDPPFPGAAATGTPSDKERRTALESGPGAKGAAARAAPCPYGTAKAAPAQRTHLKAGGLHSNPATLAAKHATPYAAPGINGLGSVHRRAYADGQAHNTTKGVKKPVKIMIDQGNLTSQGVAVSEKFMEKMNLGYSKLGRGLVPTAGAGHGMTNLGISEQFSLKLNGISKTFSVKALVCRELIDEINLGQGFFQRISRPLSETLGDEPRLHFYKDGTRLTLNRESIPLIQTITMVEEDSGMEPEGDSGMEPEVDPDDGFRPDAEVEDPEEDLDKDGAARWVCDPVTLSKYIAPDSYWTYKDRKRNPLLYTGLSLTEARRKRARENAMQDGTDKGSTPKEGIIQDKLAEVQWARRGADEPPEAPPRRAKDRTGPRRRSTSVGTRIPGCGHCLHSTEGALLKGNALTFVKSNHMPITTLVEPSRSIPGAPYARAIPAIYRKQGYIGILNLGEEDVIIPKGTEIGLALPMKAGQRALDPSPEDEPAIKTTKDGDDLQRIYDELKLDQNEILKQNPQLMADLKTLVRDYSDIFSSPERAIGKTDLVEMEIKLVPGAKPKKAGCRPLNPHQRADLKKRVQLWLDEDVVEESESPWASAMVPARKKGGEIRWAVDYRALNAVTIKDAYPLPNISENLDRMQGSRVFSTLDAAGAYHTVPVAEKSRPLLAFTTPMGLYQFKRMPFGPANSGQVYSRFMQMLVDKLRSPYVVCYVDDIILATPEIETHMVELKKLFQMHREAGICVTAKKSFLLQREADYLGYRVSSEGIHMKQDMVQKVLEWPTPTTVKELASFLGFASYYRSFIPQFAALTAEMSSQRRKKQLEWTDTMEKKFRELKEHFSRQPIRAYPDYGDKAEPFEVWPDFSGMALGGVLQQVQDGRRRLIAAGGRKTSKGESNYPPTKGELAAVVQMLRKFEHILRYKKFRVYTDHSPLKWLRSMKNPRGIIFRWLQELESYDFTVDHVAGKSTGAADGLSRSTHLRDPTPEEVAEAEEYVGRLCVMGGPNLNLGALRLNRTKIREQQEQDEVLKRVKVWVKGNPPKSKEQLRGLPEDCKVYHQHLEVLDVDEGDALVIEATPRFEGDRPTPRLLVPDLPKMRTEVFKWAHCHETAGHFGINATCLRASQKFFWPGMTSALKRDVKRCQHCLAKETQVKQRDTVHKPRKHGFPGEVLYVDLVGPLPRSDKGSVYVCTMQDGFTKFVTAVPIPNKEATTTANAILEGFITKFGCPNRIHTDQGTEFKNALWADLCDRLRIEKTETPSYNPHSNLVERFHRSLNQIFRVYMNREDKSWERFLSMACMAYNTKVNASTGISPFEAWMGRKAKLPIDLIVPVPDRMYQSEDEFVRETQQRFSSMYAFMRRNTEASFARNAKLYSGTTHGYKVGDQVWLFSKRKVKDKPQKLTDAWMGPFRITRIPAEVLLEITPAETAGRTFTAHVCRVRPFSGVERDQKYRPPREPAIEDTDDLAEEIGRPEELVEPLDSLLLPITVDREPPNILDITRPLPRPRPQAPQEKPPPKPGPRATAELGPDPSRPASPQAGPSGNPVGARPKTRQSLPDGPDGHKRDRLDTDPPEESTSKRTKKGQKKRPAEDPAIQQTRKQGKVQGTKRDREDVSPSWIKPRRRRWKEYTRSGSDTMSDLLTDDEDGGVHQVPPPGITVTVPPGTVVPKRMTRGAAGHDCRANQSLTLLPGQTATVDLGMRVGLPDGWAMLLISRSKLATEGITVEGGLIDSDYKGPVLCVLHNHTPLPRRINKGQRICQAVFLPVPDVTWTVNQSWTAISLDYLDEIPPPSHATARGEAGFGSTGC